MTRRPRLRAAAALLLAVVSATLLAPAAGAQDPAASPAARPGPTPILPAMPEPAPDPVDLVRDDGSPFSLAALRGRPTILFFGYTHCPDICPATLGEMFGVVAERPDVQVVFITLDPERDTQPFMEKWTATFPEQIIGVTGSPLAIRAVADAYGVQYARVDAASTEGYTISHTAFQTLVDRDGMIAATWVFGTPAAAIVADLAELQPPLPTIVVEDAWVRASMMTERAGAAYFHIRNTGTEDDALFSVATPIATEPQLHETTQDAQGMMAMAPVAEIPVPAGGMAVLEPGGYHVMLMGLTGPLVEGTTVPLLLTFASGTVVEVDAEVRGMGPMESPAAAHDHGSMHGGMHGSPAPSSAPTGG